MVQMAQAAHGDNLGGFMAKRKRIYTRSEAAKILYEYQKQFEASEASPMSMSTVYRKITKLPNGNWQLIGKAYDYELPPTYSAMHEAILHTEEN